MQYWALSSALPSYAKLGYTPDVRLMDLAATSCAAKFQSQHLRLFKALAKLDYRPEASILEKVEHLVSYNSLSRIAMSSSAQTQADNLCHMPQACQLAGDLTCSSGHSVSSYVGMLPSH